jgi:UMF1 family MFS transporter
MSISKKLWRWAYYYFAHASYVLVYQTFLLPIIFAAVFLKSGFGLSTWGLANGLSTLLGVLASIIIGKFSDRYDRLVFFKWSVYLSFFGMAGLSFSLASPFFLFCTYILTNGIFIVSLSLADSILPYVAEKNEAYHASGFAWGFGYLGGVLSLVTVLFLQKVIGSYSPFIFLFIAFFFIVFCMYSMRGLQTISLNEKPPTETSAQIRIPHSQKIILFIGYWLISECITVIILFFSVFASGELKLSTFAIGICLLAVQLIGIPATWYGGKLAHRYGALKLLSLTILLWGIIIIALVTKPGIATLVLAIILCGLVIGNSQSYLRAQYSTLINKHESGFQFGMFSLVSEVSVLIGPLAYGFASDKLHSQKLPILFLYGFMVLGLLLVIKVIRKIKI